MKSRTVPFLVTATVIATLAGVWIAGDRAWYGGRWPVPTIVSADEETGTAGGVSFVSGFAPVAKRVLPAVVNIASSRIVRPPASGSQAPFFSDPLFRRFFGDEFSNQLRMPHQQRERSLGSGVIVNADGYVLTNNHVVAGADEIKILLGDKRDLKGRVIGTDPKTDIAVLKIDAKGLPVISFGDSSSTHVGEFVLALGNSFGLGQTVTMGIISATGRGNLGIEDYEDFIQTDAAVNPGNSGGALVNVRGELIGINTAIATESGGNQGVGFAVPVNMARSVMDEILKHGKVTRGWIGVSIQSVSPDIAKAFALSGEPRGALVTSVSEKSPAERADILKGDIILEVNGSPIADSQELRLKIAMMAPGIIVRLRVLRDGQERDVNVTLGESAAEPEAKRSPVPQTAPGPRLGISVEQLTPQIGRELGLPADTQGVVVTEVSPGSPAEEAGIERGDVIQELGRKPVTAVDQFSRGVQQVGNQSLLLLINRAGNHFYVVIPAR